jgi:hypothetical protein
MVALTIRDGANVPRTPTVLVIRDSANTPRTLTELWIRDLNNVPRLVFNPSGSVTLAVTTNVESVHGRSHGTGTATTGSVVATVTGGTAPYTYAWVLTETDSGVPATASNPTAAATSFTQTGLAEDDFVTTTWTVTVADANGVTATATVGAYFSDFTGVIGTA